MRWSLVTWRERRGYVRCNKAPTPAVRNAVPPAARTVCLASAGCNQTRQCSGPSTLMYNGKAAMHGEPINHSGRRALQHQSINRLALPRTDVESLFETNVVLKRKIRELAIWSLGTSIVVKE